MFKKYKIHILVIILFIFALAPSVFFFIKYRATEQQLKNLQFAPADQTAKTIADVSKLMKLPEDENNDLEEFIKKRNYPSKSEFIRHLIMEKLEKNKKQLLIILHLKKDIVVRKTMMWFLLE